MADFNQIHQGKEEKKDEKKGEKKEDDKQKSNEEKYDCQKAPLTGDKN